MAVQPLYQISTILKDAISAVLSEKGHITFSKDPLAVEKSIIEYDSRMVVQGMEKFNGPCYISAFNIFESAKAQKENDALGALVVYFEEGTVIKTLKSCGYREFDEDNSEDVLNACAGLASAMAERFSEKLTAQGFKKVLLSSPIKEMNQISAGVGFCFDEQYFHEISFFIGGTKVLVADITLTGGFSH